MEKILSSSQNTLFMDDIEKLDFSMIKRKLRDTDEGLGWTIKQCNEAEKEYKRFLALKRSHPDVEVVPNKTIDLFWHQHILDTAKYAEDCDNIFGYFIHHYPYFGMNGKQDADNLTNAFEETKIMYKTYFGVDYVGNAPKCKAPKCRTACKPMKCR